MLAFTTWLCVIFWFWLWNAIWKYQELKYFHLFVSINCFDHNLISHLRSVISNQNCPDQKTIHQIPIIWVHSSAPLSFYRWKGEARECPPRPSTSLFPVSSYSSTPLDKIWQMRESVDWPSWLTMISYYNLINGKNNGAVNT